jgi:hypothetical protein
MFKFWRMLIVPLAMSFPVSAETISVGAFSSGDFSGWTEKSFRDNTHYALVDDSELNQSVRHTQGAASGRFKKVTVDLSRMPILRWSWKIEKPYTGINENAKAGDDFPVRVYVFVEHGFLGVSTKALNYVWASKIRRVQAGPIHLLLRRECWQSTAAQRIRGDGWGTGAMCART